MSVWDGNRAVAVADTRGPRWTGRRGANGQSVAEFALVLPVLVAIIGGVIQFGLIFWAQNTLTQVVRDTGRWAATQPLQCSPTPASSSTLVSELQAQAQSIASHSSLLGYSATTTWPVSPVASDSDVAAFTTSANPEGVAVAWVSDSQPATPEPCPPLNNAAVWHVTVRINHTIPVFFPGMQYLPGLGTCSSGTCNIVLSSTAQFRMEPAP